MFATLWRNRLWTAAVAAAVGMMGSIAMVHAVPIPNDQLVVTALMETGFDLDSPDSTYNPRHFGGSNFVLQINTGGQGVVRYPAGSEDPDVSRSLVGETQSRMWSPLDGGNSTQYVLLAGGSDEDQFSRLDYDSLDNRVFAGPTGREPNSFDWVDADTIIYGSYESPLRGNLYLADVSAEPFVITENTTWNANGRVSTDAGRIRNVRVGDAYSTHAYYGEAAVAVDAGFWALDLATGDSTLLGTIPIVNGEGSWGLWTVKEVDSFLYVHTTDDGVYVYNMTDATTLGSMFTHYTKEELDELSETVSQNWGFDVAAGGRLMLLSAGAGMVVEFGCPTCAPIGALQAGDANEDFEFNQLDLVQVQVAAKYLTGQPATWGEGDWNGAPGGQPGSPPPGNGFFDQLDIIAALGAGTYLTGPYATIQRNGQPDDGQSSVGYDANTGEVWIDAPAGTELTSINVDSAAEIFTGDTAQNLGGSFDNDADNNIFKATFGGSFGTLSFGNVAQPALSEEFVLGDLTVVGSLAGGGDLGDVDLIYVPVPEPSAFVVLVLGLVGLMGMASRCRVR